MADCNELFNILDDGTGQGVAPDAVSSGDAPAGLDGLIGFSFRDSSGNLTLPQLNADGSIAVSTQSPGTCVDAYASVTGVVDTKTTVAEATLNLSKVHSKVGFIVASTGLAKFELEYIDDALGTPTAEALATVITGAGQYTVCCELGCKNFDTTGGTGAQRLRVSGTSKRVACDLYAAVAALEAA